MFDLINLLGVPHVEVTLSGKIYKLSAFTIQDTAAYLQWFKWLPYHECLTETKDKDLQDETFRLCRDRTVSIRDKLVQQSMQEPAGVAYTLYLSLRKQHPEMTPELANQILDFNSIDVITAKIAEVAGAQESELDKDLGESLGQPTNP